jgi:hypothetical protein
MSARTLRRTADRQLVSRWIAIACKRSTPFSMRRTAWRLAAGFKRLWIDSGCRGPACRARRLFAPAEIGTGRGTAVAFAATRSIAHAALRITACTSNSNGTSARRQFEALTSGDPEKFDRCATERFDSRVLGCTTIRSDSTSRQTRERFALGLRAADPWHSGDMRRGSFGIGATLSVLGLAIACAGKSRETADDAAGGAAATGGSAATGGHTGGVNSEGGATTGGAPSGGSAGAAMSAVECVTADDCRLTEDCLWCEAKPVAEQATTPGPACDVTGCARLEVGPADVACKFGRCVLDVSCDGGQVTCKAAKPTPCAIAWKFAAISSVRRANNSSVAIAPVASVGSATLVAAAAARVKP